MASPANGYAAEPALEIFIASAYRLHNWLVRRPACAGVVMCDAVPQED